ncbi:MAG: LapA family protein [Nitrospirae bacterium]|nr:LapA family protein [Nitrospirota bacterium]
MWKPRLNAVLGSLVVTFGFWLFWGELPLELAVAMALGIGAFLAWQGTTVAIVWAWATLLLGMESLAWPVVTMVRIRMASAEPTEQEMGTILTAVLFGLFSSIFWLTFSYGIFKRLGNLGQESRPE